jgi:hypothetical protein
MEHETKKSEHSKYAELVTQAEQAVASVKDPELKQVAFQKILEHLLTSDVVPSSSKRAEKRDQRAQPKKHKAANDAGPTAYIKEMVEEGFFKKPKTIAETRTELGNLGHHIPVTSLSGPLQSLCKGKVLRRQKVVVGKKKSFAYSNY